MPEETAVADASCDPQWRAVGASVRGASHRRGGMPNQDALLWLPTSGRGASMVLAVSDGHGSAMSFRSQIGAHLAVSCAIPLIQSLIADESSVIQLSAVKDISEARLPVEIVREWQASVDTHLAEHPLTEDELTKLEEAMGEQARDEVESQGRLAYGATLLAVLVTPAYLLFIQLGDGDILTVTRKGVVSRPVPADSRLFANETTSLCRDEAWADFRTRLMPCYGEMPVMIMASTDGYSNSFADDSGFLEVGRDLLEILREQGIAPIESNLESWLQEASEDGSGDDITVGLLYTSEIDYRSGL